MGRSEGWGAQVSLGADIKTTLRAAYERIADKLTPPEPVTPRERQRAHDPRMADLCEEHLREHPRCEAHGRKCRGERQVCHVRPVHLFPELKYEKGNLVTACKQAHRRLSHPAGCSSWTPNFRALLAAVLKEPWNEAVIERQAYNSASFRRDGCVVDARRPIKQRAQA